ncbi:MAG: hypothetical protein AAGH79_17790 [Bacteroidota bacterium]
MKDQLLLLLLALVACQPNAQDRISIQIPSAETEAEYIWRTIQDTKFFEEHGYQVSLPRGPLIDELKEKAKAGQLSDADYSRLEKFVVERVYRAEDYQAGYDKIEDERALINQMVNAINPIDYSWGFQSYETYTIHLTLYGPGGSYNPDEGSLLLFTTPQGQFKSYDNPANTVIHEIVHIGIENSIISTYQVPHTLKERIVDTFVSLHFGNLLPSYRVQDMGENRSDAYLQQPADFLELDKVVQKILP